jgi:nanoRNase/pAp phosphatase (c-di-AMP/oligoRNAs hydrolase)
MHLRELKQRVQESLDRLLTLPMPDGPLLILTHHNPDPDCLASSCALQYLLKKKRNLDATAAYSGIIGRAENRAMVNILDLPLHSISNIDFQKFPYIALIDAQPRTGNTAVPEDREVDIVIDHHPLREQTRKSRFYEVTEELGATATLLTEFLRMSRVKIPEDLATALLYAIRSETQDLGREVSELDLIAYEHLVPLASPAKLAAISRPTLERSYYQQLSVALDSLLVSDRVTVCPMQEVGDPDFVPEMADLLVRMAGIRWVLAWGTHDDRIYLSIRTNDEHANAGEVMQQILEGFGKGGGHGMRAGGAIDLNSVTDRNHLDETLTRRFARAIGEADAELRPMRRGTEE